MRLVLASLAIGVALGALTACPTPKSPKGPPPEYEDPPAPSWLIDAGVDAGAGEAGPPASKS